MIWRRYARIGFALILVLGGCTQAAPTVSPASEPPASQVMPSVQALPPTPIAEPFFWETSWLTTEDCQAPCWEGIIPGTSTVTDALDLIQSWQAVQATVKYNDTENAYTGLDFFWYTTDERASGDIITYAESSTIRNVLLDLSQPISFGQIRDVYGLPSHVQARREVYLDEAKSDTLPVYVMVYELNLIYEPYGLIVRTGSLDTEPHIDDTLLIYLIDMTPPELATDFSPEIESPPIPWQTGKSFMWYCHDAPAFEPCKP